MDDKRTQPRISEQDTIVVTILSAPHSSDLENKTYFCSTEDISVDGLQFAVGAPLPVDSLLELRVAVSGRHRAFKQRAKVVWSRIISPDGPRRVGVRFSDNPMATQIAWRDLIDKKIHAHTVRQGVARE